MLNAKRKRAIITYKQKIFIVVPYIIPAPSSTSKRPPRIFALYSLKNIVELFFWAHNPKPNTSLFYKGSQTNPIDFSRPAKQNLNKLQVLNPIETCNTRIDMLVKGKKDIMLVKDKDMWRAILSWFHFSQILANPASNMYYWSAITFI